MNEERIESCFGAPTTGPDRQSSARSRRRASASGFTADGSSGPSCL
jgi:hypothetical protein